MSWQTPRFPLCLSPSQVSLWSIAIPEWQSAYRWLYLTLSLEEQARANRFKFEFLQRRFVITRGVLRFLLGQAMGLTPLEIPFTYSSHGKPRLCNAANFNQMQFNLSHSHERAIYALGLSRALGVDIEYLRPMPDLESLVQRFFSPREAHYFQQLPPHVQPDAFFRAWTQKEAYLKCLGTGLATPLHQVEVSLAPNGPAALLHVSAELASEPISQLWDFVPAANYVGALAIKPLSLEAGLSGIGEETLQLAKYCLHPQDFGFPALPEDDCDPAMSQP